MLDKHLKGLDTLRALAALLVVIGHTELLKAELGIPQNLEDFPSRHLAVILFFVLSGFLITLLLIKEHEQNKFINFKNFYLRRILRIWPLYYLILFLSMGFITEFKSFISYLLCFTIFPNVAHSIGEGWATSPQVWSIGVEEQFYLVWPLILHLILKYKKKLLLSILLVFIIGYSILPHLVGFLNLRFFHFENTTAIDKFFFGAKYNCIAIGALIGILYQRNFTFLSFFNQNKIFTIIGIIIISFLGLRIEFSLFNDEIYALLFASLILSTVGSNTYNIDNPITKFLGKISYGLYMYHWIVLLLLIKVLPYGDNSWQFNSIYYSLSVFITILISWLSFKYFERAFLNLKKRFRTFKK